MIIMDMIFLLCFVTSLKMSEVNFQKLNYFWFPTAILTFYWSGSKHIFQRYWSCILSLLSCHQFLACTSPNLSRLNLTRGSSLITSSDFLIVMYTPGSSWSTNSTSIHFIGIANWRFISRWGGCPWCFRWWPWDEVISTTLIWRFRWVIYKTMDCEDHVIVW